MKTPTELQQTLEAALNLHGAGRLREAETLYRKILGAAPQHADAQHYLGVVALQSNRVEDAITLITKAVENRPDYVEALVNLGNALQAQGHFADAENRLRQALQLAPNTAAIIANLGNALAGQRRYDDAIEQYEAALIIDATLTETRRCLADALLAIGQPSRALKEVARAMQTGPASMGLQVSMGNILQDLGRTEEAVDCFNAVLNVRPDFPPILCNLGNVLRQSGQTAKAIETYEKALATDPNYAEGHHNLGVAFQDLGQKDNARKSFRQAAALDPSCTKAWRSLAGLSRLKRDDADFQAIQHAAAKENYTDEQRMHLAFAIGKCSEDVRDHENAFKHFREGNQLRRSGFDYDVDDDLTAMQNLTARIGTDFIEQWDDVGNSDETPVFIVGMPRSGTTLVEQILASHAQVYGGGELRLFARAIANQFEMVDGVDYSKSLASATAQEIRAIADRYLAGVRALDSDALRITDKLPNNFLNVGLIHLALPKARIVHCVRDPRDTCFSIYKHYFGALGHYYAYDLVDLGHYYNGYANLMSHWREVIPGKIHDVCYESLVENQESVTRALLDACELEWDPACLAFHESKRPVTTISASQVRQPLYSGSVGAWRNYEEALTPLLDVLRQRSGS